MRVSPGLIAAVAVLTLAPSALAHEGHGNPEWFGSFLHYLIEPVHLPLTLAASVVLVTATRWVSNKLLQRTARARRR